MLAFAIFVIFEHNSSQPQVKQLFQTFILVVSFTLFQFLPVSSAIKWKNHFLPIFSSFFQVSWKKYLSSGINLTPGIGKSFSRLVADMSQSLTISKETAPLIMSRL